MSAGNSNSAKTASTAIYCKPTATDRRRIASVRLKDDPAPSNKQEASPTEAVETRNLRRLQVMMQLLVGTIHQDRSLSVEDAAQLVANTRNAVLRMFPGKEQAFHVLCRPRIQRAMRERFHIQ